MPLVLNGVEYLLPQEAAEHLSLNTDQFKHRLYRLKLIPVARRQHKTPLFLAAELDKKRAVIVKGKVAARAQKRSGK